MKKYFIFLLLLFCGCSGERSDLTRWLQPNDKLKVLCTTGMIEDLVSQIGGPYVDTMVLIKGELDPHSYQLVKGDDEKISYADLIFYNGLGLEHGPSLKSSLEGNPGAVGLGNKLLQQNPSQILTYHGTLDPHIWMDISLWTKTVPLIVEALSEKDPARRDYYTQNGERLVEMMMSTHNDLKKVMNRVPEEKRYLITSHDAFNYFARAYLADDGELESDAWQKRFAAPEGLSPESQLSVTDIRLILDHMKAHHIRVIFPESNVSRASIQKLKSAGNEEGLSLQIAPGPLYGDAMGSPGSPGDTYIKMVSHNVRLIAEYLNLNGGKDEQ
jgi:manganese/zinc/iron transport system substrate-binding protein